MNRLKALRIAAGYDSQRELANAIASQANGNRALTVSYASIARMEAGEANPRWNIVHALAHFFRVPADYLMGAEEESYAEEDETQRVIRVMAENFAGEVISVTRQGTNALTQEE